MGTPRTPRFGSAQPKAHGSARRDSGDGRLDPVRWRRPGRVTLMRLTAVALLLATAAAVSWSPPGSCVAPGGAPTVSASRSGVDAAPRGSVQPAAAPSGGVPPGSVGVPIRLADPTALSLVRPGNRVDLLRPDDRGGRAAAVADAALVLEVTGADDPTTGGLLLALTPDEAERAVTTPERGFAVLIRPG